MATSKKNRQRREIILLALLCAVCLGVALYFLVSRTNLFRPALPEESETTSVSETGNDVGKLIEGFFFDDAVSFSYRSVRQPETLAYSYDGNRWQWDGDGEFPVNNSMVYAMIYSLTNMTPSRTFDADLVDRAAFGLEEPSAVATVTYRTYNGKSAAYEILFGAKNEMLNTTYVQCTQSGAASLYCMVEGDAAEMFSYTFLETADPSVMPDFAALNLSSVAVMSPDSDAPATFSESSAAAQAINAIKLLSIVDFKPTEDALKRYGLDEAHAIHVKVSYREVLEVAGEDGSPYLVTVPKERNLTFGATAPNDSSRCFFSVDGTYLVYMISSAFLQAIAG